VEEDTGKVFAHLVARALSAPSIVTVPRDVLKRVTPADSTAHDFTNPIPRGARVFVVDVGINYGKTMKALITVCRIANATPLGAIVLDSRLDESEVRGLSKLMGGAPLLALYTWPGVSPQL
jgi:adenine/guanine phosphoribosyltransferase-like PRPP-binding protein